MSSKLTRTRLRGRACRGGAVIEVMLEMRPNGWCLDHYRIALDGTVLETQVVATNVFRAPVHLHQRDGHEERIYPLRRGGQP
jgi:hypothetical protein